jgi:type I restriction-modification system DNA methylase subunit
MREYINANIRVIRTDLKKRTKKLSKLNSDSIREEFKEWNDPSFDKELIWTLPDLTRIDRYKNFCRSIKKEIR